MLAKLIGYGAIAAILFFVVLPFLTGLLWKALVLGAIVVGGVYALNRVK